MEAPLVINETCKGLFTVVLPACDTSVLSKVLDPEVPYVWLIDYRSHEAQDWIEQHLPPLFGESPRVEFIRLRRFEMDVVLSTPDFLRFLPAFAGRGIDLIQAGRQLPRNLSVADLKPEAKARIFRDVGVVLEFHLPHPHEYASAASPSRDFLEKIVRLFST